MKTKLFMLRTAIHQLAHPLALAASGLFMAALTILPITQVPTANAQTVRCPCYNEMFIVGACGRHPTCQVGQQQDLVNALSCPDDFDVVGSPGSFQFITSSTQTSFGLICAVLVQTGRSVEEPAIANRQTNLTGDELAECDRVLYDAAYTLGCTSD